MNDIEFSSKLHNLLSDSGYKCETTANDNGNNNFIGNKSGGQFMETTISDTKRTM
jgi:hypothetical protein